MAVAFDATGAGAVGIDVSSISWTHTPVGAPSGVAVFGGADDGGGALTVNSATYGGTATSKAVNQQFLFQQGDADLAIYGLANPASGAQTVSISSSAVADRIFGNSITVTGGDTTTVFSNNASNTSQSTWNSSVTVTSASNELGCDVIWVPNGNTANLTAQGSQTQRFMQTSGNRRFGGSSLPGSASLTFNWAIDFGTPPWGACAVSFKEAAAGGAQMFLMNPSRTDGIGRGGIFPGNRLQ